MDHFLAIQGWCIGIKKSNGIYTVLGGKDPKLSKKQPRSIVFTY